MTAAAPHFVYGTLRPRELAYHQIGGDVARVEPAMLHGHRLYVRDGLPFVTAKAGHSVKGEVLYPVDDALARKIEAYEGSKLYFPETHDVQVAVGTVSARVYVGRSPRKGRPDSLDGPWSSAGDPLITGGLRVLGLMAAEHLADAERVAIPADMSGFWERFIPLQGIYLSLASVLERYTALTVGPTVDPTPRVMSVDKDPDAQAAVTRADPPQIEVVRSDDLAKTLRAPGPKAWQAWYAVRSNLSHRGKSAYADFQLIERAVVGLHDALRIVIATKLGDHVPAVSDGDLLRPTYEQFR